MTDHREEQLNEIEALESIYPDEIVLNYVKPYHNFTITLTSQNPLDTVENATVEINFIYTETYPDTLPQFEIKSYENLEDTHVEELTELMRTQGEENLGMVMVFTMVSAVLERLGEMVEEIAQEREDEKERKVKAEEEKERKKFEGTRVTIESFLNWKKAFDAEMDEIARQNKTKVKEVKGLTGRELFMTDHTLDDSDVKFLEQEGDNVEVDESLFEDLEDLDIDEELTLEAES